MPYKVITSRLLCFKNQCVPDPVGYVRDIHRILDKNKLSEYLNYFYETSIFPTKQIWKRIVQKNVFEHGEAKWQTSISLTPEIIHFLQIHPTLNMHKAWEIAHSTPLLKEQAHHVISVCASWRLRSSQGLCPLCKVQYSNLLVHVINYCHYSSETRDTFWCSIFVVGPTELNTELHNLPDDKFILQLLSCNPPVNVDKDTAKLYREVVVHFIYLLSKLYF